MECQSYQAGMAGGRVWNFEVGFHLVKKVVIGGTEQILDGWNVITAATEPFGASQQRVETRVVGSRTHS